MDLIVRTNPGFEDMTKKEFENNGYFNIKILKDGFLIIEDLKEIDIAKITYNFRSINYSGILLKIIDLKNLNTLKEEISKIKWGDFISGPFAVRSENINSDLRSLEINSIVGEIIKEKTGCKVDLEYPDFLVKVFLLKDKIIVSLDLAGYELWKRGYRIFMHPSALKSTLAFQMILFSEWDCNRNLLDPLCGSGTIPIEACIYARNIPSQYWNKNKILMRNYSFLNIDDSFFEKEDKKIKKIKLEVMGFDKNLKYLRGAEINATRALVRDTIRFSRIELEWIDVKLGEGVIDCIITNPPFGLKEGNMEEAKKILKLLFYQAEYILKPDGKLTVITIHPKEAKEFARKYNLELEKEKEVYHGNLKTHVLLFKKI